MRFAVIVILLAVLACPSLAQSYRYSFEGTYEGWTPDACDDMPGPNWHITLNQSYHASGAWSLEYYLANYNDATKIWIEKPFLVAIGQTYSVRVRWYFASSDWGDFNLFNIIASISGRDPETRTDFTVIGNTGNGNGHGYVWLPKEYLKQSVVPGESGIPGAGVIWVGIGVWGTWETPRTYYVDLVLVDITPAPPTQTVTISQARGLRDGSVVRLEDRAVSSGTGDLAGRVYVEEQGRSAGIAVEPVSTTTQVARNKRLTVQGVLETIDGERIVRNPTISLSPLPDFVVEPVLLGNRETGGGPFGAYTPGVVGSAGLNNVGLLVTACGRVVYRGSDFVVIDDGGRKTSCGKCPAQGVALPTTGLAGGGTIPIPSDQSYVVVTGISSCFRDSATGQIFPLLRPRNSQDVRAVFP